LLLNDIDGQLTSDVKVDLNVMRGARGRGDIEYDVSQGSGEHFDVVGQQRRHERHREFNQRRCVIEGVDGSRRVDRQRGLSHVLNL